MARTGTDRGNSEELKTDQAAPQRPDGRARRWAEHRRVRRDALVAAAIEAIEAEGADIGVDAIAAYVGISRTVLYRYFDGRDDLQLAVARRAVGLLVGSLTRSLRSGTTPRRMITGVVRAHLRWLDRHPELYRLIAARSATGTAGPAAFAEGETLFAAQLSDLLGHYTAMLGVRGESVQPLAFGLIGMVEAAGDWWVRHGQGSQRQLIATLSDSIWYVIDGNLRARGAVLDPDLPLPTRRASKEE